MTYIDARNGGKRTTAGSRRWGLLLFLLIPSAAGAQQQDPRVRAFVTNVSSAGVSASYPLYIQWTPANTLTTDINLVGSSITFTNPGAITNPNYIQFNTAFADGSAVGRLQWDIDTGTLEVGLPGGDVNLQIGQEEVTYVKNTSGGDITNGQVVRITGESGGVPTIGLADADNPLANKHIIGLATEDIANGTWGYVTNAGIVHDLNTNAFTAGDGLYLSATAGGYTKTEPAPPARIVHIGHILDKNPTTGAILVHIIDLTENISVSSVTASVVVASSFTQTPQLCLGGTCRSGYPALTPQPHAVIYSTVTQAIASTAANQHITFSTAAHFYGFTTTNWSTFTVTNEGIYEFCFSGIADITALPAGRIEFWMRKNGLDITDSNTIISITTANQEMTMAVCLIENFNSGNTFTAMTYGSDTDLQWLYTAASTTPTRPATPSVILTAKKISELE